MCCVVVEISVLEFPPAAAEAATAVLRTAAAAEAAAAAATTAETGSAVPVALYHFFNAQTLVLGRNLSPRYSSAKQTKLNERLLASNRQQGGAKKTFHLRPNAPFGVSRY